MPPGKPSVPVEWHTSTSVWTAQTGLNWVTNKTETAHRAGGVRKRWVWEGLGVRKRWVWEGLGMDECNENGLYEILKDLTERSHVKTEK